MPVKIFREAALLRCFCDPRELLCAFEWDSTNDGHEYWKRRFNGFDAMSLHDYQFIDMLVQDHVYNRQIGPPPNGIYPMDELTDRKLSVAFDFSNTMQGMDYWTGQVRMIQLFGNVMPYAQDCLDHWGVYPAFAVESSSPQAIDYSAITASIVGGKI